ncbi:thiol reductant ABC exporter subunit CydC [Lapillicoccus jejuensis]|uniref:ATP-binding cassette subfamily C protein CydC n=1 Tax=Lapillicoccus jejuensis TaxID=402171 RepID=A0A542DYM9_9MICO|nr:thiol reductant ABC exporter subunit CydC [Lapillicoccus jejuensis]TQJ08178.1 ATP-binding cassette subfamily C protein CydC [Lapillicoccus jejuensis]
MTAATGTTSRPRTPLRAYGASVLLGAAATLSGVALTATSGWLVVRASERPVVLTLLTAVVGVRAFGISRPLLRWAERVRSHDVALGDLARAREDVARRLVPLTPARLGRRHRAEVAGAVVDDLTDLTEAPVRAGVPLAAAAVTVLATAGLTALVSPTVALVHVALAAALAGVTLLAVRLEADGQARLEQARAEVLRVGELVALRRRDLLAVGAGTDARRWLDEAQAHWSAAVRRQARGRALAQGAAVALLGGATAAAALVVARLDVAAPVAALLVLTPVALSDALTPLADAARSLARARAARRRLDVLLDQPPAVVERPAHDTVTSPVPHLRLEAAGARWRPTEPTAAGADALDLDPVDLDLPPGSRTLVTGPNGGGKSTLLALLARQLDPATGRLLVDGTDARDLPLADLRSRVAVVDDEPWVLATSLRENLRIARPRPEPLDGPDLDARLVRGLREAGLGPWYDDLPAGLDTRLGTGDRALSGGERTRLGLARALVSERGVLLLDEPVAHLDAGTAAQVMGDVAAAAGRRTLVVVSHDDLPAGVVDRTVRVGPSEDGTR